MGVVLAKDKYIIVIIIREKSKDLPFENPRNLKKKKKIKIFLERNHVDFIRSKVFASWKNSSILVL